MALPHPFKTTRKTGSPSAGGNVHTLAQHMASPTAHPNYVRKGEQVGGASIADHEMSSSAHTQSLLRRAELALTAADYTTSCMINTEFYDAVHHRYLETAYPVVCTTAMLYAILGTSDNISSGPLSHILNQGQLIHSIESMNSLSDSVMVSKVPSLALIKQIHGLIDDFITEEYARENFATIDHVHPEYAASAHTHNLYDVFLTVGGSRIYPAREDHNHDDIYWRKDESIASAVDWTPLAEVGIYPNAFLHQELSGTDVEKVTFDINEKTRQGNFTYWLTKKLATREGAMLNFPEEITDTLKTLKYTLSTDPAHVVATENTVVVTGNLSVLRTEAPGGGLIPSDDADMLHGSPTKSALGQSALQRLVTNLSMQDIDRSFTSDAKNAKLVQELRFKLHREYLRNGYSYETARWMTDVIRHVLGMTPAEFYKVGTDASDPVADIADAVNNAFNGFFAAYKTNGTCGIPGAIPGYIVADSDWARSVRVSRSMLSASIYNSKLKLNGRYANTECDQGDVIIHDLSPWIVQGGEIAGLDYSSDRIDASIKAAATFIKYSERYLDYIPYFMIDDKYIGIQSFTNPAETAGLVIRRSTTGSYQDFDTADVTSGQYIDVSGDITPDDDLLNCAGTMDDLLTTPGGDVVIDVNSRVLHGYIKLHEAGTFYERTADKEKVDGKSYFWFNGTTYNPFSGEEFAEGVEYFEKFVYDTKYKADDEYFVKSTVGNGTILPSFIKLTKGVHWNPGGLVGKSKDNQTVPLDVSGIANAADNTVYVRVAIRQHVVIKTELTADEITAGPVSGVTYFTLGTDGEYTEASVGSGFEDGVTYFKDVDRLNKLWSKKPVAEGTKYSASQLYYMWSGPLEWINVTDSTSSKPAADFSGDEVVIPEGGVLYVDWTDVYKHENEPVQVEDMPASGTRGYLSQGLFVISRDTEFIKDKRYYVRSTASKHLGKNIFTKYIPKTGDVTPMGRVDSDAANPVYIYECVDVERILDIWCAIRELTTTGAYQTLGDETIVYNFGEDGSLIAWDAWTKVILSDDELIRALSAYSAEQLAAMANNSHAHGNKTTLDKLGRTSERPTYENKELAFRSELDALADSEQLRGTMRAAVSAQEFVGNGDPFVLQQEISNWREVYYLKVLIRPTDSSKTIADLLSEEGSTMLARLSMTTGTLSTGDVSISLTNDDKLRVAHTHATSGNDVVTEFACTDPGRAICVAISSDNSTVFRNIGFATALDHDTVANSGRTWIELGDSLTTHRVIMVGAGFTVKLEWAKELLVNSEASMTYQVKESAKKFVRISTGGSGTGGSGHNHSNLDILSKFTLIDAVLSYDGNPLQFGKTEPEHTHSNLSILEQVTQTIIDDSHSHSNKAALDKVTDAVVSNSHTHANKGVVDKLTQAVLDNSHTHSNTDALNALTVAKVNMIHQHSNAGTLDRLSGTDKLLFNGNEVAMKSDVSTGSGHTHANMAILDTITQSVVKDSHAHSNMLVLEKLTQSVIDSSHTHTNKAVLDKVTQTMLDGLHTHSNKAVLDTITADSIHTHSNKAVVDKLTQSVIDNSHTHSNRAVLDKVTQSVVDNSHTHSNKAALDKITDDIADSIHSHSNKTQLDKVGETSGRPTYNGAGIAMQGDFVVLSRAEYNALSTKSSSTFYFVYDA